MSHKKTKNKKNKRRNLFINILAGFLILLSLALIFNSKIRDIFLVWNTNKYQVNQVTKENIDENLKTEGNFDFDSVKSISSEAVLASQWDAQKLPVIGGIAIRSRDHETGPKNGRRKLFSSQSPYLYC